MGRTRIDPEEKKVRISFSIKKKYADKLRQYRNGNMSKIIEDLIKKYLKM